MSTRRRWTHNTTATIGSKDATNIGCNQNPNPASTPNSTAMSRLGGAASIRSVATTNAAMLTSIPDA